MSIALIVGPPSATERLLELTLAESAMALDVHVFGTLLESGRHSVTLHATSNSTWSHFVDVTLRSAPTLTVIEARPANGVVNFAHAAFAGRSARELLILCPPSLGTTLYQLETLADHTFTVETTSTGRFSGGPPCDFDEAASKLADCVIF